jgi:hypothetical protein
MGRLIWQELHIYCYCYQGYDVEFYILTALFLRIQVFWNITLCVTPEELTPQGHDMLHTVEET